MKFFTIKYLSKFYILHNLYFKHKYYLKRKSYSDSGEDLYILSNLGKKGFYVDVGCHHPTRLNNCHLLYLNGWSGINIDPSEISIKLFDFARKKDTNICSAVSLKKGLVDFYYNKPLSLYNSLIENKDLKNKKLINSDTLSSILDKTKFKNRHIDFLSVDAEGKDFEVIQSLDFHRYSPKFICIEIWTETKHKNYELNKSEIYKFLIEKEYSVVFNKKENYIFKRKKIMN